MPKRRIKPDFEEEMNGTREDDEAFEEFLFERCKIIGENVRIERKKRRFSIDDLANYIGLSASYVGLLERGDRCPSLKSLFRLCELFDIEATELFTARGDEAKAKVAEKKSNYKNGYETVLSLLHGLDNSDYIFIANTIKAFRKYNKIEKDAE